MEKIPSHLDHIVWACHELKQGISYIEKLTGAKVFLGGRHTNYGTHNAILPLSANAYLEIIAADPTSKNCSKKWMAVDLIDKPKITRWSIQSENLVSHSQILKSLSPELSEIINGRRKQKNGDILIWKMTNPGNKPVVSPAPFLIDWGDTGQHPCQNLPIKCSLNEIQISSDEPNKYTSLFKSLNLNVKINKAKQNTILVKIKSPKGIVTLQ